MVLIVLFSHFKRFKIVPWLWTLKIMFLTTISKQSYFEMIFAEKLLESWKRTVSEVTVTFVWNIQINLPSDVDL